uniref:FCP1 homology domain-containing protein n=1 Tax=Catharus ustulatus TaxID=91951 RepID=A0A8C3U4X0_CATUS
VSQWYELVVFTASMEIYGCAVADKLDNNRSILNRRYYRQHCTLELGSYIKDLSVVHSDLSSIVILDNSPGAYRSHPDNAIPIKSWFSDPGDTALLNLLPMLDGFEGSWGAFGVSWKGFGGDLRGPGRVLGGPGRV